MPGSFSGAPPVGPPPGLGHGKGPVQRLAREVDEFFQGASAGTTITTGNTSFNAITGSPTFQTDPAGTRTVARFLTGSLQTARWTTKAVGPSEIATAGRHFMRTYVYLTGNIAAAFSKCTGFRDDQAAQLVNGWTFWNTGSPALRLVSLSGNAGNNNALSLNTWYRLEVGADYDTRVLTGRIFLGDSTTPLYTDTYTWPLIARTITGGVASSVFINNESANPTAYFADVAYSSEDWLGPSGNFTTAIDATFTATVSADTADGGSASFTGDGLLTANVGGDTADGGSATFVGTSPDATFTGTVGGDAADGSAASFTGTGTFTGALGGDAADGSTASLTASSAFTANAGGDTTGGGSASLTGSATFSGTVGGDSASGAAASFTVTGDATFTATAGGDAADGGTASLTASSTFTGSAGGDIGIGSAASFTGSGTFSTLVATADADGNVALMAGSATFATLDSTSTAEGATVSFVPALPPESGRAEGASPAAPGIRHDNPAAATVVGAAPTTPRAGG